MKSFDSIAENKFTGSVAIKRQGIHFLALLILSLAGFTSHLDAAAPLGNFTTSTANTSQNGTNETIPLQATVTVSPPAITIESYVAGTFTISRKDPSATSWGTPVATGVALSAGGTWKDSNVNVGQLYEYQFVNTAGTPATIFQTIYPTGYILTGIQVDQTQPKGMFAVICANDLPGNMPAQYAQYKQDLMDDGWQVREIQVPRCPDNYTGLGNGAINTVKVTSGGTTSMTSGSTVYLTNPSGKEAEGTVTVSAGAVTAVSSSVSVNGVGGGGNQGSGFNVGDALTISGGEVTSGTQAAVIANVSAAQATLNYAEPITGGTGYTNGQTVTLTGQTSGKTAQCTINTGTGGAISSFSIVSSQTGFVTGEPLTMSGNTTGSGIGALLAYVYQNALDYVYIYGNDTGYTQGEAGTLTGQTSGATAQVTLSVYQGHIDFVDAASSQPGFITGETCVLSGTASGSNAPLFTASVTDTGPLTSVTINSGGTGYTNGAIVQITGGSSPAQGTLSVTSGAITGITLTSPGAGFSQGVGVSLVPVTSVAPTLSVLTVNNSNRGSPVAISAGGSGYSDNDTVTIKGNTSGATATGSLIAPNGSITGISVVLADTGAAGSFTTGETLTITPTLGGSGVAATVGAPLDNHMAIRSAVQAIYNAYPGQLKNIVMVGKVPVCRSGINDGAGADGHGNECPYGADAFYAEMLGVIGTDWTDTQDNSADSPYGVEFNLPGDSQYDQQTISQININGTGMVQLGYGRIDLALGIQTEIPAEINYFNKLHLYKINDPSFQPGRNVGDDLTYPNVRETDLQSMPGVVGMSNIAFITPSQLPAVTADQDADQLYTTQNGPFLFYFKGGGGPGPGVGGKAVFWTGMQSHWGYWYQGSLVSQGSNLMQLRLSENSFTLDFTWDIWGMRYIYHRMGMGMDAGDMMKQSINNQGWTNGPYTYDFNNAYDGDFHGSLYMDQMGDPALRLFMFAPPTALSVVGITGNAVLNWTASTEPTVTGYHVYRAPYANAPFTRLTTTPITGTTYADTTASSGSSYVYMVRAICLETTGGGTYYNASLGTTQSFTLGAAPTPVTISTTSIPAIAWETASLTQLVASGGVPQYSWSYTGSLPAGLTLSSSGVLSGTATGVGAFLITVKVTDQIGQTATQALTITVNSDTSTVLYPEATTYTQSSNPTTSFGTYESNVVAGPVGTDETFQRYNLSGINLYNGFQKATLYEYVTDATQSNVYSLVQANLLTDAVDQWVANGITRPITSYSKNGSGKVRITCTNHGFTTGTLVTIAGITGSGAPSGSYSVTVIDANDFDLTTVTYVAGWTLSSPTAATSSLTYNTRPTTYDTNVPTLTLTGTDTPGTWLQVDVTQYVKEVIKNNFANFPSQKMGLRLFTGTSEGQIPGFAGSLAVELGSLSSFGNTWPYIVFQTTNAPNITVNSPTQNPVSLNVGSSIYLSTTVTPLPARAANLTLQWSQVSGPGTATFTNPTSAATGVSFSAAGQYIVQLTANDGVAQSYQQFTINVLAVPVTGPTDSIVMRLPFDEGTGTTAYDYSGNNPGNNGTLTADPTTNPLSIWSSSGKINGCLSFASGGQSVLVPDASTFSSNPPPALDGYQQLAISCWIYANAFAASSSQTNFLLTKRNAQGNRDSYAMSFRGGNTGQAAMSCEFNNSSALGSTTTFVTGKWYHVVWQFDGTTTTDNLQIWVNGIPDRFGSSTLASLPRNTSNLHIGSDNNDTVGWNGMIDEVRIYHRILTQTEIQALAAATPSNLGPVITTNPSLSGQVGSPLALSATVVDNDPAGGALTYSWSQLTGPGTINIASPTSISTTGTPNQPGSYGLQFLANDGVITAYANVSASITGQTYSSWAAANGLTGNNALMTAVLEPDGLNNLFKYALGLNPTTIYNPGSSALPSISQVVSGGSTYLTLTFDGVATDVTYKVQASSDLVNWSTIQSFPSGGPAPGNQTVQDTQSIGTTPMRYMRLYMTSP